MNDLLKLLSRSLQPFGYHIRKYGAPNILKIPSLEKSANLHNIIALRKAARAGFFPADSNLDQMVIYVRTCVRADRNIDARPRVTGSDMGENTLRCLRSLVTSTNNATKLGAIRLIILDDRSDPSFQGKIKAVAAKLQCPWSFEQTSETGQGKSLHEQFGRARTENAIVYFCEDDYLHEPDAVSVCWNFYRETAARIGTHMMIYPQEHAVLYDDHYPSYIVTGAGRHWRTMRHATHTFLTHSMVVNEFWKYFENTKYVGVRKKRKLGSEARTTNRLFKHIPGFSPIKPAAVHLQFENTLPPLYDWRPLWEANAEGAGP
jgi:hypothetical protein